MPRKHAKPSVPPALANALQRLHSQELSGCVRYFHYAHMIFGANRIPIVAWLKDQATEATDHAWKIGEKMTAMGLHPEMRVEPMPETGKHSVLEVLKEALDYERRGLAAYQDLLALVLKVAPGDVALEDWVRGFIAAETEHLQEAEKMLRTM
jgi:bacterioferritin